MGSLVYGCRPGARDLETASEPQTASQTKATQKYSGVSLLRNTPESCGLVTLFLELETSSQLNLPLAEKSAVSAGNTVEARGATAKV